MPAYSEGSALAYFGSGIWIKMHMFSMIAYKVLVYLDADYLVTNTLDELFSVPTFAASVSESKHYRTGDFAGGLLVVHPNVEVADAIARSLSLNDRFLFGEQDFLNIFFSNDRVLLPHTYGCIAEMLHLYEDPWGSCKVGTWIYVAPCVYVPVCVYPRVGG